MNKSTINGKPVVTDENTSAWGEYLMGCAKGKKPIAKSVTVVNGKVSGADATVVVNGKKQ